MDSIETVDDIPGASLSIVLGVVHITLMQKPEKFNAAVLAFPVM